MKIKTPFLIAEISSNHNGSLSNAKKLIKSAKLNGADAVKLQTYTPDGMTLNSKKKYFKIKDGLWKNKYLWDLYNEAQTPLSWHKELFDFAKKEKIIIFSTPFDEKSVDFLEKLKCPIYKISSFELTDIPLIKKIASTKKPIIISTGLSSLNEIELSYNVAKKNGAKDITILYCVSNYPSKISDFNLNNLKILKKKFKCRVGLSDHSTDNSVAVAAVSLGAEVIEKHFALDNQKKGFDIKFSIKGKDLKKFKLDITNAHKVIGKKFFFRTKDEMKNKKFRRSIFAIDDIKKDEKFTTKNIGRIRPGNGISPKFYEYLLGKNSPKNINYAEPLSDKILNILSKNKK